MTRPTPDWPAEITLLLGDRAAAACRMLGPKALASHGTAAVLWGLEVPVTLQSDSRPHVLVPMGFSVRPGVPAVLYRTRCLGPPDAAVLGRAPVTTVARTLVDLAVIDADAYARAFDDALARHLVRLGELRSVLARVGVQGRAGGGVVLSSIGIWDGGGIESPAEALLARWILRNKLPAPVRQLEVADARARRARLDCAWPRLRVALEVDGYAFHREAGSFVADRRRDSWLASLGWTTLHTTVPELRDGAADLLAALAHLGVTARGRRPGTALSLRRSLSGNAETFGKR